MTERPGRRAGATGTPGVDRGVGAAGRPTARLVTVAIFAATVVQLAVAAFVPGLEQFEGKGFLARLVAYPLLMLVVPAGWWLVRRSRRAAWPVPWSAFALVMAPFLVDVTGNSANLYDTVSWWDDANHFGNWFLLCAGLGLLLVPTRIRPGWALGLLVAGLGAVLAIGWEVGEWWTFIRHGTELATAYEDTLGDEVLGTLGGALAGVLVSRLARRRQPGPGPAGSPAGGPGAGPGAGPVGRAAGDPRRPPGPAPAPAGRGRSSRSPRSGRAPRSRGGSR